MHRISVPRQQKRGATSSWEFPRILNFPMPMSMLAKLFVVWATLSTQLGDDLRARGRNHVVLWFAGRDPNNKQSNCPLKLHRPLVDPSVSHQNMSCQQVCTIFMVASQSNCQHRSRIM